MSATEKQKAGWRYRYLTESVNRQRVHRAIDRDNRKKREGKGPTLAEYERRQAIHETMGRVCRGSLFDGPLNDVTDEAES